jgi:hypothetical protein
LADDPALPPSLRILQPTSVALFDDRIISKAGWSWGCVATVDREGRIIFVADAHRDDGQRFVVHADDKFTGFLELERAICVHLLYEQIKS